MGKKKGKHGKERNKKDHKAGLGWAGLGWAGLGWAGQGRGGGRRAGGLRVERQRRLEAPALPPCLGCVGLSSCDLLQICVNLILFNVAHQGRTDDIDPEVVW